MYDCLSISAKDDGDGGDNRSYKTAKLRPNHRHQQTNNNKYLCDYLNQLIMNRTCSPAVLVTIRYQAYLNLLIISIALTLFSWPVKCLGDGILVVMI